MGFNHPVAVLIFVFLRIDFLGRYLLKPLQGRKEGRKEGALEKKKAMGASILP